VLNDTMMVVWNRGDSYNGASKVSTWIFAIAYRKALKAELEKKVADLGAQAAEALATCSRGAGDSEAGKGAAAKLRHRPNSASPFHMAVSEQWSSYSGRG